MRVIIYGSAILALLAGDVAAQTIDTKSNEKKAAAPAAQAKTATPAAKPARKPAAAAPATAPGAKTSKITFHSRPSGARITLSNGKSCIAPCSFVVGFNEKFTAIASKAGYQNKEILVSPSLTDIGKAQVIGSALGAGLIGLAVGAAIADRAYGPEPFVVELSPGSGGPAPATAASAASAAAAANSATPANFPAPVRDVRSARAAAPAKTAPPAVACDKSGCTAIKAGCRVVEPAHGGSPTAIGGHSNTVVCR